VSARCDLQRGASVVDLRPVTRALVPGFEAVTVGSSSHPGPVPATAVRHRVGSSVDESRPAGARGERPPPRWVLVVALVVAGAVTAAALHQHVMWFDELQAWNIARVSSSVGDLARHLRYEGHPIAWYLLLFGLTRFTGDPRAMQVLELTIVLASYALILFKAPFTVPVRVALVGGYFVSFEYGVLSRAYSLEVLALLAALVALARPRPAWLAAGLAATLLAWTSLAGAVLALVLAGTVALNARTRHLPTADPPTADRGRRRFVLGVGVAAIAAACTCIPPSDFHEFTPSLGNLASVGVAGPTRLLTAVGGIWRGLMPIPIRAGAWNTQLLDRLPGATWIEAGLSVVLFVIVARALRPFPQARTLWWLGSVALVVFFVVVVLPDQDRYAGPTMLVFLGAAWFGAADPMSGLPAGTGHHRRGPRPGGRRLAALIGVVLGAQIIALVAIEPWVSTRPFSPDRAIAQAATAHHVQDRLVSGNDFDAIGVSGYLDRDTYSVARHAWMRYFVHDELEARRFRSGSGPEAVCAAARLAGEQHRPAGLVTEARVAGVGIQRVALHDHVALYLVDADAANPTCSRPV
jgi:hypothetical protein